MNLWIIIIIAGLATFATRLSFIILLEKIRVPVWFQRSLRFVPVAVLSAITFPELVNYKGMFSIAFRNPQLLSGILAVIVAWRTKNVILTILAGMAALFIMQVILGFLP